MSWCELFRCKNQLMLLSRHIWLSWLNLVYPSSPAKSPFFPPRFYEYFVGYVKTFKPCYNKATKTTSIHVTCILCNMFVMLTYIYLLLLHLWVLLQACSIYCFALLHCKTFILFYCNQFNKTKNIVPKSEPREVSQSYTSF